MLGTGTQSDPFIIRTEDDLDSIRYLHYKYQYYELGNDITLTKWQTDKGWTPIGLGLPKSTRPEQRPFAGFFDGKGYSIHNLYQSDFDYNDATIPTLGLFGVINNSEETIPGNSNNVKFRTVIKNINLKNININGYKKAIGGLVGTSNHLGYMRNNIDVNTQPRIENCFVDGVINGYASLSVGGVFGGGTIEQDIKGRTVWVGNLVDGFPDVEGLVVTTITQCKSNMLINTGNATYVGLIAGNSGYKIDKCIGEGRIDGNAKFVGGIAGGHSIVNNSYSTAFLRGSESVGGIMGRALIYKSNAGTTGNTIQNCFFTGTAVVRPIWEQRDLYSESIGDFNSTNPYYNHTTPPILPNTFVGGIVGSTKGTMWLQDDKGVYREIVDSLVTDDGIYSGNSYFLYLGSNRMYLNNYYKEGSVIKSSGFTWDTYYMVSKAGFKKTNVELTDRFSFLGFDFYRVWYDDVDNNKHPQLRWYTNEDDDLIGTGTFENPFKLRSVDELVSIFGVMNEKMESNPNTWNKERSNHLTYVELVNDIDFNVFPYNVRGWHSPFTGIQSDYIGTWETLVDNLGREAGYSYIERYDACSIHLDGKGFSFLNVNVNNSNREDRMNGGNQLIPYAKTVGVFGALQHSVIKNLTIQADVTGSHIDAWNVEYDPRYYNSTNSPIIENPSELDKNVGILAGLLIAPNTIENVKVVGTITTNHPSANVGGLVGQTIENNIFVRERRNGVGDAFQQRYTVPNDHVNRIRNVHVDAEINYNPTAPNTSGGLGGFAGNVGSKGTDIGKSFSTSKINIPYNKLSPITSVFIGNHNILANAVGSVITNSYYDSTVVNIPIGSEEASVLHLKDINSKSTAELSLQSTFTGWDFTYVWNSDGLSYPQFAPYNADYFIAERKVERAVRFSLEVLNTSVGSVSLKRKLGLVRVKSQSKRITSKTKELKIKHNVVESQVAELYNTAFQYNNPKIAFRDTSHYVNALNVSIESASAFHKIVNLSSTVDGLGMNIETFGVKRAQPPVPVIDVLGINGTVFHIKLRNDVRFVTFYINDNEIGATNALEFQLAIRQSDIAMGNNVLRIVATVNGQTSTTKTFEVNKVVNTNISTNNKVIINGKQFNVTNTSNTGEQFTLTLDSTLEKEMLEGDTLEVLHSYYTPYVDLIESTETANYQPMTHVRSIYLMDGEVEDEYEINDSGDILESKIVLERDNVNDDIYVKDVYKIFTPQYRNDTSF